MLTENALQEFSVEALFELMALTLEDFEQLEENQKDLKLRILKRNELELIQKLIDEKKEICRHIHSSTSTHGGTF
jgi:hypothetical protein